MKKPQFKVKSVSYQTCQPGSSGYNVNQKHQRPLSRGGELKSWNSPGFGKLCKPSLKGPRDHIYVISERHKGIRHKTFILAR